MDCAINMWNLLVLCSLKEMEYNVCSYCKSTIVADNTSKIKFQPQNENNVKYHYLTFFDAKESLLEQLQHLLYLYVYWVFILFCVSTQPGGEYVPCITDRNSSLLISLGTEYVQLQ